MNAPDTYLALMSSVRRRFDIIELLQRSSIAEFTKGESAAFHGRKVIETIAFGCLVAIDHSLKSVPKDAKGKWNAEEIFRSLGKKNINVLPSPSTIRSATPEERATLGVGAIVEGIPANRLTHLELIEMYRRLHPWTHEVNPYTMRSHEEFAAKCATQLWIDLSRLRGFVSKHMMTIQGSGFYCVLEDDNDHTTKVHYFSREKIA